MRCARSSRVFALGDRRADEVGNGHRLRTQRRHERDGRALLERRPGDGIDARDVARRDVQAVDAGSAIFTLNPRSMQARLRIVDRRADQLRNVRVVGDQVRPRAPRRGGEREHQEQDAREPPEPAALRPFGTRDRLRGRGHERHPFGDGAVAAHLGEVARQRRPASGRAAGPTRSTRGRGASPWRSPAGARGRGRWPTATNPSSSFGTLATADDGFGTRPDRCLYAMLIAVSPVNGSRPVSSSYVTMPSEYRSDARVGRLAADLLGGRGTAPCPGTPPACVCLAVGVRAGQAEVGDLHGAAGRDEDVLGLDVAVDDALARARPPGRAASVARPRRPAPAPAGRSRSAARARRGRGRTP